VDGGIDPMTAQMCVEAGASVLVAGTAIFGGNNGVSEAMSRLRAGRE
jgi:pentose-5-phosphate-3-epimerase